MNKGTLYGIGVGPGDPELLTIKAARILRECEVIAVPQKKAEDCFALKIASAAVPEILKKPILTIDMPMTRDMEERKRAYRAGAQKLRETLEAGQSIAFLTLGDPSVYSTFTYLLKELKNEGVKAEIIPGVTSFCAAAAALGEPLCEDRQQLHIIPSKADYEAAIAYSGTKVFMKGDLKNLIEELSSSDLTVKAAENCGTQGEKLYNSLEEIPADAGYYTVLIAKERET